MSEERSAALVIQGWPILLTTEMAAQYFSLDEDGFLEVMRALKMLPAMAGDDKLRWLRRDLERGCWTAPQGCCRPSGAQIAKNDGHG